MLLIGAVALLDQGRMHYPALPRLKFEMLEPLRARSGEHLGRNAAFREVSGLT
jgi:hypothetical protein